MLLYAITQRSLFSGDENERSQSLLTQVRSLARGGIACLQIREKDLPLPALQSLAAAAVTLARSEGSPMKILLNGPATTALEAGCDGIHLPSHAAPATADSARLLYRRAGRYCTLSAACHTLAEVRERSRYADLLLVSPIFEKIPEKSTLQGHIPGAGLSVLSEAVAVARGIPVLALGGITARNAGSCIAAGAEGIAAIRLFHGEEWKSLAQP